jgi:hypothetical protein
MPGYRGLQETGSATNRDTAAGERQMRDQVTILIQQQQQQISKLQELLMEQKE